MYKTFFLVYVDNLKKCLVLYDYKLSLFPAYLQSMLNTNDQVS